VGASAFGGATLASGASTSTKDTTTSTATTTTTTLSSSGRTPETPLTGDVLAAATKAALARTGGGTVDSATTETDSSNAAAAYEVHVTESDGTHVTVILDKDDNVLSIDTGARGGCPGPGGAANGETSLTGDTATNATKAATDRVGGTADFATTETDSSNAAAAYEVHVTKADGTHVTVIEDRNFNVLSVETEPQHGFRSPSGSSSAGSPGALQINGFLRVR